MQYPPLTQFVQTNLAKLHLSLYYLYQRNHEHQHAEKPVQITGCDVQGGHPVLLNGLDL